MELGYLTSRTFTSSAFDKIVKWMQKILNAMTMRSMETSLQFTLNLGSIPYSTLSTEDSTSFVDNETKKFKILWQQKSAWK
jgi:pyruvate carboxylase